MGESRGVELNAMAPAKSRRRIAVLTLAACLLLPAFAGAREGAAGRAGAFLRMGILTDGPLSRISNSPVSVEPSHIAFTRARASGRLSCAKLRVRSTIVCT